MAQALAWGRQAPIARTGGFLSALVTYISAAGAAVRTTTAAAGHNRPGVNDMNILGIEDTVAYSAVTGH